MHYIPSETIQAYIYIYIYIYIYMSMWSLIFLVLVIVTVVCMLGSVLILVDILCLHYFPSEPIQGYFHSCG